MAIKKENHTDVPAIKATRIFECIFYHDYMEIIYVLI